MVGAKVVANIEYPNAGLHNKTRLEMRDDGAGADIVKGDGTYSAYIINSKAKGKHSINIEVASVGGTSVKTVTTYSKAGAISGTLSLFIIDRLTNYSSNYYVNYIRGSVF